MRIRRDRRLDPDGRAARVRPILLMLVMGAFLVIATVTASGQVLLTTTDESNTLLLNAVRSDAAAVRSYVALNLLPPAITTTDQQTEHAGRPNGKSHHRTRNVSAGFLGPQRRCPRVGRVGRPLHPGEPANRDWDLPLHPGPIGNPS